MARTGLYQSEVKKARDALIAQGKHPSVDAVRVALGNTGSKTTIHKYLKELEGIDAGASGRKVSLSDVLQDLVTRLSSQLHDEAELKIVEIETKSLEKHRHHADLLAALTRENEGMAIQLKDAATAMRIELEVHEETRAELRHETIGRHTAEQQVADLKERLMENLTHRMSLEEKHTHAREALEHYRQSAKEQRDQDQRRHEQQVQQLQAEIRKLQQGIVVKQEDITRLNQEGARLVADISHAQKSLYDHELLGRQRVQHIAVLQEEAQKSSVMATQLVTQEVQISSLNKQLEAVSKDAQASLSRAHGLEVSLAIAQVTLASQHEISLALRNHLTVLEGATRNRDNP